MSLMSKLLMSTLITTLSLSATTIPSEKALLKYIKKSVIKNPQVDVQGITILESQTHEALPGWTILLTTMDLEYQKKELHAPETMFVKDGLITGHLANLKTGKDYRSSIKPSVPASFYNDAHLLFGNKDAKHKLLVFSDPQCPFCQEVVPDILEAAKKNPTKLAIYYYHLPLLRIHPVSDVLTRVMHLAQDAGKMDVVAKMYSLKISAKETNMSKILSAVKKHTGFSVSAKEVDATEGKDTLKADVEAAGRMMVSGTPTVYIDGEWDKTRHGYKKLID